MYRLGLTAYAWRGHSDNEVEETLIPYFFQDIIFKFDIKKSACWKKMLLVNTTITLWV